jgi:N-acetylglucosamine-6-phosphate deacetylase
LPDLNLAHRLVDAAGDCLKIVTLAPELPGALELIRYLANQGMVISAGHTAATYNDLQQAISAGLRMATHAGNASDWPHRAIGDLGFLSSQPGLVGTLMADERLCAGIIMDGFHFHPALLAPLLKLKGPDKLFLVSDASTVAGCPPGEYESGGLQVTIHPQGFATSGRGGGWLAGSTITLLDAVQRAVRLAGIPLQTAVHMATLGPARVIGIQQTCGHLSPGANADLVILNQDLILRHSLLAGKIVNPP